MASKRIVITGVSRGLGNALAQELIALGHTIVGCARNVDALNRKISDHAGHRFDALDLGDLQATQSWAESVIETHGPPDLLINNAGVINGNAPLWRVPVEEFVRVTDVNLNAVFVLCRTFLPSMIDHHNGVIVNLSSGWGRSVAADVAPYCASKWAIEGMTQALAQELPAPLAAVPLNPGVINTDMLQSCFGEHASQYDSAAVWAKTAAPFLLSLDRSHNGKPLTAP